MASDLAANLDSLTTTLDGASGVTAYWVVDLNPNSLPTAAYVALQTIDGGAFGGGFNDTDLSFSDLVVQLTSWSPVSFDDAFTKAQAAFDALSGWSIDTTVTPVPQSEGWRGVRFDIRFTASYDAIT